MKEQRKEFHALIDSISNPKLMSYLYLLVKNFIEIRK